ncbi:hypothetical protein [Sporosarcina highlanderae]|uniref:Uncharacterized protein n=1 Tax=Sporosarcina highlanderae TaxID=3035916 RepID=A0ABT8JU45_9BACL|nr:hypothetical protein [Sporosarcina highlanderae]MDN4608640.1 hypothetical protein [Sporosarcina highlanderae]
MIDVHYSAISRQVFVDEGTKTTAIDLPDGLDAVEIAYVLQSDTLREIVAALVGKERVK